MTAREQDAIVRRAFEGGAFGDERALHDEWIAPDWSHDERGRQVPSPEQFAIAVDLVLRAEAILGERVAPKRRFKVFELAYWGAPGRGWTHPFKLSLEEAFWSLP